MHQLELASQWYDAMKEKAGCWTMDDGARLLMKVIIKNEHTRFHEEAADKDRG